jgi:hypothetical protein
MHPKVFPLIKKAHIGISTGIILWLADHLIDEQPFISFIPIIPLGQNRKKPLNDL